MSGDDNSKIRCRWCNGETHTIKEHIKREHPGKTEADYQAEFPDAPTASPYAKRMIEKHEMAQAAAAAAKVTTLHPGAKTAPFHEVFGLGDDPAAKNAKGGPIPITVFDSKEHANLIPPVDPNYIFDVPNLKDVLLGLELNIPTYVHGHAGVGKTTIIEQVCARTKRPMFRLQHTIGMEERDVVGQWTVKEGQTVFQYGPLPLAMINGWMFLADEYDRAVPGVLSLYQAVLEGKSLVIKEAPPEMRVVHPHPHFRICATGNTNGSGDEHGLYQATQIGDAANYERFGITIEQKYMANELEVAMLMKKGGIGQSRAEALVEFATKIREQFKATKLSHTISPRTLLYAASLGTRKGSFRQGITLAFTNRLSSTDHEVADQLAQRLFDKT